jgi:hypothetical protein
VVAQNKKEEGVNLTPSSFLFLHIQKFRTIKESNTFVVFWKSAKVSNIESVRFLAHYSVLAHAKRSNPSHKE